MALTLLQRLKVVWRGWSRRRDEEQKKFLAKNIGWAPPASVLLPAARGEGARRADEGPIDLEGLQVAYLDDSGRIAYYLDVETGDVVDVRDGRAMAADRYKPVPQRTAESEAEDRRAFVATVEDGRMRQALSIAREGADFRRVLATDRAVERAWYNFKNDRATAAIEQWLATLSRA